MNNSSSFFLDFHKEGSKYENLIATGYSKITGPQPVGSWVITPGVFSTRFHVYKRPTDAQIRNTEELLGWVWEEAPPSSPDLPSDLPSGEL